VIEAQVEWRCSVQVPVDEKLLVVVVLRRILVLQQLLDGTHVADIGARVELRVLRPAVGPLAGVIPSRPAGLLGREEHVALGLQEAVADQQQAVDTQA
jgi:hypothetical protein